MTSIIVATWPIIGCSNKSSMYYSKTYYNNNSQFDYKRNNYYLNLASGLMIINVSQ